MLPVTQDGRAGHQHCNLTTQNGALIKTAEDFFKCAWAASVLGTLQAAYTTYPYLSNATKELTEEEALLGVSITGIMDNADVLLNPKNLQKAAGIVKSTNEIWARKLGINPAARTTCIKPEGTSSLVLKSASGAHPHEARKYIRRVQANTVDPVYKFFKKQNSHMCEESVWSAHKTDDVIAFPVIVPETAMVKADLTALQHLEIIKLLQQNWVIPGTTKYNKKPITHNVSCTVLVEEKEWDSVMNYLYDNREYFAAVALLPKTHGKLFEQMPLEEITSSQEDQVLWNKIVSEFKHVDYTQLKEDEDSTTLQQELVCAGGQCELPILSNT
jgi:ribonucleoside-triphosphate reductase (thioredoxin)